MKKRSIIPSLITAFLLMALHLSACSASFQETDSSLDSMGENSPLSAESGMDSQISESQLLDFTIANLSMRENVSVDYPQIQGTGYDQTNEFLRKTVKEVVQIRLSEPTSQVTASLAGNITYWDGRILCFVLEGLWNDSSAAHPVSVWLPILIDLDHQTLVSLADLLSVDKELVVSFRQAYREQVVSGLEEKLQTDLSQESESLKQLLDQMTDEAIRSALSQTALDSDGSLQGFFTNAGMGVSVALPHALGDHFEVYLERR